MITPGIMDFSLEELRQRIAPAFRAKQIFQWLYHHYVTDFNAMENLPKALRSELAETYALDPLEIVAIETANDGTKKYLFRLYDGHTIESVLIPMQPEKYDASGAILQQARYSVCLSSQVGCKVGCSFCLTAKGGFVRNLTPGEIVGQVVAIKRDNDFDAAKRLNLVYMGMGEPLDNLDAVAKAISIIAETDGLSISPRRQTISTSGISSRIDALGKLDLGVQLAISLHAVTDALRQELIPMNKAFPIETIIESVRRFPVDTRKRIMFEYLMIRDLNDDLTSAKRLVKLLHGLKAKVNLIYFNPHEGSVYQRPTTEKVEAFQEFVRSKGITCTIRESKGIDISAACGQLRERGE